MTVLRGRTIVPGIVEGEALVSRETISGWGGIDPATGTIVERRHELHGVCFTGKILVFPGAKGSSGWSGFFQSTRLLGTAPLGMIFTVVTTKAALGAVVTRVPALSDLDQDPVAVIRTGDHLRLDADHGFVEIVGRAGFSDSPGPVPRPGAAGAPGAATSDGRRSRPRPRRSLP